MFAHQNGKEDETSLGIGSDFAESELSFLS
jgi:hypothetical protein